MLTTNGQIVYLETGKIFSSFHYKNSSGRSLDNLTGSNQNNLGFGIQFPINKSRYQFTCGFAYNRYGAKGSDPILGNYYEWDVSCLGIKAEIGYEFFRPEMAYNEMHGFSFYPKLSIATEFLINGTQNLNDQVYDLKGVEEFDKPFYFLRGGLGVNYYISKTFIVFLEYMGGTNILIGDYNGKEQLRIRTHNISIGISVNCKTIFE